MIRLCLLFRRKRPHSNTTSEDRHPAADSQRWVGGRIRVMQRERCRAENSAYEGNLSFRYHFMSFFFLLYTLNVPVFHSNRYSLILRASIRKHSHGSPYSHDVHARPSHLCLPHDNACRCHKQQRGSDQASRHSRCHRRCRHPKHRSCNSFRISLPMSPQITTQLRSSHPHHP